VPFTCQSSTKKNAADLLQGVKTSSPKRYAAEFFNSIFQQ
jgi:hypothetical protein